MNEISIFLKNRLLTTKAEYRILENYTCPGKIWLILHKPTATSPYYIREKSLEYIMDIDTLLLFRLVSQNILAQWDTNITKNLKLHEEYHLCDSLFICHCCY